MNQLVCLRDETAVIGVFEVDVDVSRQRTVLVSDHGRTMRKEDLRYLSQRNLCSGWRADENATHLVDIVAEVPLVANIDGIALSAFDILRNILSADTR